MTNWYTPIREANDGPGWGDADKAALRSRRNPILITFAVVSIIVFFVTFSPSRIKNSEMLFAPSDGWNVSRLQEVSQTTLAFRNGDNHEVLRSCYAPNATMVSPLSPSGIARGAESIVHQSVATRAFASDASFVTNSLGLSTHTVNKDSNAITAAVGHYVHTGVDAVSGQQCEVDNPMHIFQEIDENFQVVSEWQHVNYTAFLHNLKQCNSLNLPVGAAVANQVINKVFPDVVEYGWNGTELINLVDRFWSDLNEDINAVHESVTIELRAAVEALGRLMQDAGISTTTVAPNTPSLVINAKSQEWSTLSVVVAQEVVGIDVQTGGRCSFRMQWVHAYIIQRHYRIAGFVTAGNSNDFKVKMSHCNKFGTKEYGYHNSKQQQIAAQTVMDTLMKNRFLEHVLSGDIRVKMTNNSLSIDEKKKSVRKTALTPTAEPTTAAELDPSEPKANQNKGKSDYCLCLSKTGCALPGAYECCDGLTCSGDSHHSRCVPTDSTESGGKCIVTGKDGCDDSKKCCNPEAKCTSSKKDHGVCRLRCESDSTDSASRRYF